MLWGEIKVDFNDLKHIVHPNRRFDELYNTIMTCLRDLHVLSSGFQTSSSGLERRLVAAAWLYVGLLRLLRLDL